MMLGFILKKLIRFFAMRQFKLLLATLLTMASKKAHGHHPKRTR